MISSFQRGAYSSHVNLEDGSMQTIEEYVQKMETELLAPGTVMLSIHAEVLYHPVLSSISSPASEAWVFESSPLGGIKVIYVPTLAQLGLDAGQYKLEAKAAVVALDFNATTDDVSLRVIDLSDSSTVTGSSATGTLNGQNAEQQIESGFFDITPGQAYFVDTKKHDGSSVQPAAFARQELLIRVVKL